MKYLIGISLITLLSACAETKQTQTSSTNTTPVESEKSMEQIALNPLRATDYALQVNQTALLKMSEHGSVGIASEVFIEDKTILTLVSDEFTYTKEPEEGTTGGDGGVRGYIFKALKTGKTTITAKDMFRGELKCETVFNITVQ